MKFCEAMQKLKEGYKVTRSPWNKGLYFKVIDSEVKSFQPRLTPYIYNEDIMISTGWIIEDREEEMNFCDIIPFLQQGKKSTRIDWNESFIYLDVPTKSLVMHSMDIFNFLPDFSSFVAEDWITISTER